MSIEPREEYVNYTKRHHIDADRIPAYRYLEELSQKKGAELERLFGGLDQYFAHANETQEELIRLSSDAARQVLMVQALMTVLEGNADIKDIAALQKKILDTLRSLMPQKNFWFKGMTHPEGSGFEVPELPTSLLSIIKLTVANPAGSPAALKLRAILESWIDIKHYPMGEDFKTLSREFVQNRQELTQALTRYEAKLRALPKDPTLDYYMEEIEAFRNGIIPKFPKKPGSLATIDDREVLHFLMTDRTMPLHPRVKNILDMRDAIRILAHDPQKTVPELIARESGVKSRRRTIEKLVYDKNCDWSRMTDMARVNIVFNDVEDMFYYNRVLRNYMMKEGWTFDPGKDDPCTDRGVKMHSTGSMSWLMNMRSPKGSNYLNVEIKLDDMEQYQAETVSHVIYECMRKLLGDDHKITITEKRFQEFQAYSQKAITALLTHSEETIPSDLKDILQGVQDRLTALNGKPSDIQVAASSFLEMLQAAHRVSCATAAKKATKGMAALYAIKWEELYTGKTHTGEQVEKVIDLPLNKVGGPERGEDLDYTDIHVARVLSLIAAHKELLQERGPGR